MYCIKLFYMNDASILNKKKSNIVKTRCYVINLFFINLHMSFACVPFHRQRLTPHHTYILGCVLRNNI